MFRKLVSNLAFSPALVGQIGFYAKRLRKEEATRRIGLIFTALALVVQSFAVFSPPEAANASSGNDFISGGISTKADYIKYYDQNHNNIKDLFTELGITRKNLQDATLGKLNSRDGVYSWGLKSHFSKAQGEHSYTVKTSSGGKRTFYGRPLYLWDTKEYTKKYGSTYEAYIGKSSTGAYFAVLKICGNLVLKAVPPAPKCPTGYTGTYPDCTKVPEKCPIDGKTNLNADDPNCKQDPQAACSALKVTKLVDRYQLDGSAITAYGGTVSAYTYVVKRDGKVVDTIKQSSSSLTNTAFTTQTEQGTYTVTLTVKTSLGDKTGDGCAKSFTIPAPEMCPVNPDLLASSPECQPCPDDDTIWIKDDDCAAALINSKTAKNASQGDVDATTTTAKAGDKITYSLSLANTGKAPAEVTPTEELDDILEYATVIDAGGGTYNEQAKTLTWPTITLNAGDTQTRMFTVQVLDTIPAMGTGVSNKTSYDCRIDNTFGNTVGIDVDCPVEKQIVEQTVSELPHTGPRENMIFAGITIAIVAYFYARSRQLKKEVRLIRRDLNAGTI